MLLAALVLPPVLPGAVIATPLVFAPLPLELCASLDELLSDTLPVELALLSDELPAPDVETELEPPLLAAPLESGLSREASSGVELPPPSDADPKEMSAQW